MLQYVKFNMGWAEFEPDTSDLEIKGVGRNRFWDGGPDRSGIEPPV